AGFSDVNAEPDCRRILPCPSPVRPFVARARQEASMPKTSVSKISPSERAKAAAAVKMMRRRIREAPDPGLEALRINFQLLRNMVSIAEGLTDDARTAIVWQLERIASMFRLKLAPAHWPSKPFPK